ncbi:MAG: HigA family addiction module antidote protein [Symploca sp. SIO2G7]|nr:HigA family addiction module antidote protein [Symploca sp. SIO2G7]
MRRRKPTHPGSIIKRHYLEPLNITITELAKILDVSRKTVSEIVNERCSVTPNMALRLAVRCGRSPTSSSGFRVLITFINQEVGDLDCCVKVETGSFLMKMKPDFTQMIRFATNNQ